MTDSSQTVSPANRHGNFGFNVHNTSSGPKGQSVFTFRGADGYDYVVKSNSWQGGGDAIGLHSTPSAANATWPSSTPPPGCRSPAPATPNTYAISVYTPQGLLWHQAGTTASQLPLGGGNIAVHPR